MTDIVLRDIDIVLAERIRKLAEARGWSTHEAILRLLEHGLMACEAEQAFKFDDGESEALLKAIAAMEDVPNDPGFAMIGRVAPDQETG